MLIDHLLIQRMKTNFGFEKQLDINQFKKKEQDFDIEY